MSENQMQILWSKKQTVDLGRAGQLSGLHPALTSLDLRTLHDTMSAFAIAQALLQGIGGGQTENALAVRALRPSDFSYSVSSVDTQITDQSWRQPPTLATTDNYLLATGTDAGIEVADIYNTTKASGNDQKILIIYGLRAIGVGNQHSGTVVRSIQWQFWRKGVKLIDRWYIEQLNSAMENFVCGITPIMYKKDDIAAIRIVADTTTADANKFDRLQVLGVTCLALGQETQG